MGADILFLKIYTYKSIISSVRQSCANERGQSRQTPNPYIYSESRSPNDGHGHTKNIFQKYL